MFLRVIDISNYFLKNLLHSILSMSAASWWRCGCIAFKCHFQNGSLGKATGSFSQSYSKNNIYIVSNSSIWTFAVLKQLIIIENVVPYLTVKSSWKTVVSSIVEQVHKVYNQCKPKQSFTFIWKTCTLVQMFAALVVDDNWSDMKQFNRWC